MDEGLNVHTAMEFEGRPSQPLRPGQLPKNGDENSAANYSFPMAQVQPSLL